MSKKTQNVLYFEDIHILKEKQLSYIVMY